MAARSFTTVGKPAPRVEGREKVTGTALYSADVRLPRTLWAVNVQSPYAHARIRSIDRSRAVAMPGVRAVLTAADIPNRRTGRALKDQPLLCDDRVRFIGDRVAVVAAEDVDAAWEAAGLLEVEYEELPAVFDPLEAMQPGAPLVHPDARSYRGFHPAIPPGIPNVCGYRQHQHGEVDEAFARADRVVEHTFQTHLAHQGYLEPHACVVAIGAEGRVEVWASNKVPYNMRKEMAGTIERPEADIVIHPVVVGGDFGSKGGPGDGPLAYYLARTTGRPIKFVASSQEDLVATSHRHPSVVTIRSGLTREGRIVARQATVVYNSGAYGALKPNADGMLNGVDHLAGPYDIPNLLVEGFAVYTNTPPSGYMRAPGHAQVIFAVEAHTDLLAREMGMDPIEFRLRNLAQRGPGGAESAAPRVLQAAAEAIGWSAPAKPLVGRGVAIAMRGTGVGEGTSDLTLNPDGTISVLTVMPDNGTGAHTVVAQVVAESMGLPLEKVKIVRAPTDALPVDVGSGASRVTNVAGHAALAACEALRGQLRPLACAALGADEAQWDGTGWRSPEGRRLTLVDLATELLAPGDPVAHARVTLSLERSPDRGYCVQAAEVEVDAETGQVRLLQMASAQDVGTVVNPLGHQGQIEGGLVQGVGLALMEELALEDGRVTNPHLGEYKLPTAKDISMLSTVNILTTGPGPFEAKAIGELPSVPGAAAIANAVADAIGAPVFSLPVTPERVLAVLETTREAPSPPPFPP